MINFFIFLCRFIIIIFIRYYFLRKILTFQKIQKILIDSAKTGYKVTIKARNFKIYMPISRKYCELLIIQSTIEHYNPVSQALLYLCQSLVKHISYHCLKHDQLPLNSLSILILPLRHCIFPPELVTSGIHAS